MVVPAAMVVMMLVMWFETNTDPKKKASKSYMRNSATVGLLVGLTVMLNQGGVKMIKEVVDDIIPGPAMF